MKSTITTIVMAILAGTILIAESIKIAYIDTERVMAESRDTQEAQNVFQTEQESWKNEISELDAEIERLYSEYETKKMILTESGKQEAEDKINELSIEREALVQEIYGESGKAMQRNAELLEPILTKLKNVIEKVSVENNYTIVLDASAGGILYAKPSLDITDDIILELDEAVE